MTSDITFPMGGRPSIDRKSTRLNSSHLGISYAVFCLKKKMLPALQIVIGAIWALANDTEFARLHVLDLGDLLQDLSGIEVLHGANIYLCIYHTTKKEGFGAIFPIGVLRPFGKITYLRFANCGWRR